VDRSEGVTSTHQPNLGQPPTVDELRQMTPEEAMVAGAEVDGVHIVHRRERFPIPGTKAEKRVERAVSSMFLIAALAGVGFIVVFIAWPYKFQLPGSGQRFAYYTPLLGALLGLMLLALGVGAVLWGKWLMPEEEVVQDRHDDPSSDQDQLMTAATLSVGFHDTGLPRRSLLLRSLLLGGGALATVPLVALLGALVRKPGKQLFHTPYDQPKSKYPNGVPIVYADGRRATANDLQPGGIATVFPGVPGGITDANSPTLLIRLRPGQSVQPKSLGFEDYVAFSKICTHAGCPASLYEQQTGRLLCPCHQSQFDVLQSAKPVFGPATRSLPQLPLGVEEINGTRYFVATGDFPGPVGPGFWEHP
jgi:ubiquinol-cytochrome c reductase iron-sulfur subunit